MALREQMKGRIGVVVAVVCFAAAAFVVWNSLNKASHKDYGQQVWVYNLDTGELLMMPTATTHAPVQLDNGTGYTTYVFSCTTCDDESARQVGYLTRYTDEAKAALEAGLTAETQWVQMSEERSQLIATIDQAKAGDWLPSGRMRADNMFLASIEVCGGTGYKICQPE